MNVLQVSKFYHPVAGGIERVVQQLAEGLRTRRHDVEVLSARQRGRSLSTTVNGVPVRRVGSLGVFLSAPVAPTFPRHLSRCSRDTDIVHYHLPNPTAVVSHLLAGPNTQTVVTYHSDIVKQATSFRVYRPVLKQFLADVDRILTTSPRLRESSPVLRPFREKTSAVPLGVDPTVVRPTPHSDGAQADTGEPIVLFVGRLTYYKGVSILLRAFEGVDGGRLLIVGTGDRREHLESLAASLGLGDRVRFLGFVPDDELARLYQKGDLFVLPSVEPSEAFGIVQLEAMSNGIPVINTDLSSGVPWVSRDGESGLTVPPKDVGALRDAIQSLLSNPDKREELGRRGRERVESNFTEQAMVSRTEEIYHDLVT